MKKIDADRIAEVIIDLKRIIELNHESIMLQQRDHSGGISEYLKGWSDANRIAVSKLTKLIAA